MQLRNLSGRCQFRPWHPGSSASGTHSGTLQPCRLERLHCVWLMLCGSPSHPRPQRQAMIRFSHRSMKQLCGLKSHQCNHIPAFCGWFVNPTRPSAPTARGAWLSLDAWPMYARNSTAWQSVPWPSRVIALNDSQRLLSLSGACAAAMASVAPSNQIPVS